MMFIAPYVASPYTIWSVIACLMVWAGWSGYRLRAGVRSFALQLGQLQDAFGIAGTPSAFRARYESISGDLAESPLIGDRWREYQNALWIPDSGPIRATAPSSEWFTADLLQSQFPRFGLRYHAALPGLLVGAGLAFTFFGLAFALQSAGGIVADEVTQSERNSALHELLGAASFKFWTSVAGIVLSLVYSLFRQYCLKQADDALDAFQTALDRCVPLITPVQMQAEATGHLEAQTAAIQSFSNELAVNVAGVFDNAFDKRLGEHIGPLASAMQSLAESLTGRNEDAMERMLAGFLEKLQGQAGDQMAGVVERLADLASGLDGLQTGMRDAAQRMADAADVMTQRMSVGAEQAMAGVTAQMTALVDTLRSLADEARSAGAESGKDLAARLEGAAAGFERSAQTVATTLADAASRLEDRMGSQAEDSGRRLAAQFDAMIESLKNLADNSRSMGTTALDAVAARIDGAAASFQGVSERIVTALEGAARQTGGAFDKGAADAVDRIAAATEGMRSEMQTMLATMRTSIADLGIAMTEGGKAGADTMRGTLAQAGADLAQALNAAAQHIGGAGQAASTALRQGGDAAGGRLETAGTTFADRAGALARQVATLTEASDRLSVRLGELNTATGDAARPLTEATGRMRQVADAMQSSTSAMTDIANRAAGLLDQVAATAQRLEAAQAGSIRLTDSLSKATERFEGVDKDLASVVTQLQGGITRFANDVGRFVIDIDSNLAKAVTQLANLVKDLETTIDEFTTTRSGARR